MSTLSTTAAAAATGKPSWGRLVGWGLFLAILAWSWKGAEMNPAVLFRDAGNMATFAADFFPPDFGNWKLYLSEMLVTVQIALWGTVLAIVRATGASALQEVIFGVIPQVLPLWISYSLYRFESNVRSATVVGMVGAGGIGVILWEAIRGFQFGQTCAVLIVIIVVVSLIDVLSQRLRKLFI